MNSFNYRPILLLAAMFAMLSCSTENYSEEERTKAYFLQKLDGEVSSAQWWKTSVTLWVEVMMDEPTKILLLSSEDAGTLYDYREVEGHGIYNMTAPQGKGNLLYLMYVCNKKKYLHPITLSGKSVETVQIDVKEDSKSLQSKMRSPMMDLIHPQDLSLDEDGPHYDPNVDPSLHGKSIVGNAEHYEFSLEQKLELVEMLKILMRSEVNPKTDNLNSDYELKSNGPFRITWLTGYEQYQDSHILGYYFHSPGTYDDMEFHDIAETHKYDIIDGLAKVQYQIRDTSYVAHPEYGILPNKWYDANYDLKDVFGAVSASNSRRLGDQAYNGFDVFRKFGTGVSRLRGISFPIDVPEGKHLGFYLKKDEVKAPEQWDQLHRLGIKNIGKRENWKATNFCAESFNQGKTHRSCVIPYEHTIWMGMEDVFTGGDYDCNDVIFGMTAASEILKPDPIDPDINEIIDIADKMPWTIAYEDIGRKADFDFNDAVIRLMPDFDKEECCVMVEAVGSASRMYLHYDGPDGDVNLGEIHEILGGQPGMKINTSTSVAQIPFVQVACVPWPKDFTMAQDAKRFWIEIQRGDCADCTDAITLAEEPGQLPEALLVAGEWKWPMEGVHIFSAYNSFPNWAKDVSKTTYWNWYSKPKADTVVSY